MKPAKSSFAAAVAVTLILISGASQTWAASSVQSQTAMAESGQAKPPKAHLPLQVPIGLALDAKGNLYVANSQGNNILVYNSNYVQQTAKTISTGVSHPMAVAFDSVGNIYVANQGTSSITVYSPDGVQNTARTMTNGVLSPYTIAVDALDDVWVANNYQGTYSLVSFSPDGIPLYTLTPDSTAYLVATHGRNFVEAGPEGSFLYLTGEIVANLISGEVQLGGRVSSIAFDKNGLFYVSQFTGEVDLWNFQAGYGVEIFASGLDGSDGIAVDATRGRVYMSSGEGSVIVVYSMTGTQLKVLN